MIHSEDPLSSSHADIPSEVRIDNSKALYAAPELFPRARDYRRESLRAYVEEIMVDLAERGELVLTDLFNQPQHLRNLAGQVILGDYIDFDDDNKSKRDTSRIPLAISEYTVKVRSRTDRPKLGPDGEPTGVTAEPIPIHWKKGMEPRKVKSYQAVPGGKTGAVGQVRRVEEVQYTTGKTEVTLPIAHAWNCLRQHGKYCRHATKERTRQKLWWYVEAAVDDKENPKPKRGRPPKE